MALNQHKAMPQIGIAFFSPPKMSKKRLNGNHGSVENFWG